MSEDKREERFFDLLENAGFFCRRYSSADDLRSAAKILWSHCAKLDEGNLPGALNLTVKDLVNAYAQAYERPTPPLRWAFALPSPDFPDWEDGGEEEG